jgi:hypothetical protein
MTLPDDICRCQDNLCNRKDDCARWVQRWQGGMYAVQADTLNPDGHAECRSFIQQPQESVSHRISRVSIEEEREDE